MSEIKVNKITPRVACGTTQLGDSGDTFTIPSGATITNLGTATGFGGTGVVSWDTGSIKTTGFTAVTGTGYFCNTTAAGFTVTLPASPSAGDVVGVSDYAKTFDTDNLTLDRNSENIGGGALNATVSTAGIAVTLVYVDSTKGWIVTDSGNQSDAAGPEYIAATGGCITTCGNYKMHTFYSPATFCVSSLGNPGGGPNSVDYLVVAGGGGAQGSSPDGGGGGGAGGYRESPGTATGCYTVSPLGAAPAAAIAVTVQGYPIVVGGGGSCTSSGVDSSGLGITSAGGGAGAVCSSPPIPPSNLTGGSGGSQRNATGFAGNTPPTNPAQGTPGGDGLEPNYSPANYFGGGGGGATVAGADATPAGGGNGGAGAGTAINLTTMPAPSPTPSAQIGTPGPSPSVRYFSGGGGGGIAPVRPNGPTQPTTGGTGGGGNNCQTGTINTGGGAGSKVCSVASTGGSGIVVIRYKYQ